MQVGDRVTLTDRPLTGRGEVVRFSGERIMVLLEDGRKVWRDRLSVMPNPGVSTERA
jgi:hypothetical protein